MKAQLALCMKYMPAACMKSLTLTHEGLEFGFAKFQFTEQREPPRQRKLPLPFFCMRYHFFSQEKGSNSATAFGSAQERLRMA